MDLDWIAIAVGDVVWIAIAFALGLTSRLAGLPPLVGFLGAGFLLNAFGFSSGDMLEKLSDLGITLLLFTVGLKLNLRTLARPQVWAVTGLHTAAVVTIFTTLIYGLAVLGVTVFANLTLQTAMLIAFALSFSSTVFVVKTLEDKGEIMTLHGRLAVGILIMQDIAAVVFLAISAGETPSPWAILVVLLFPLRPLLFRLLKGAVHGELLVLYGFLLAVGGAAIFELVGLKGDLGALVFGVLIAAHPKADEMAKTMVSFKDLFLLGFFLSIGMSGQLTAETFLIGALITPFVLLKSALFLGLLTRFKLRSRTALFTTLTLSNYSEFGLIVLTVGVANNWISADWLLILAVALSLSFVFAASLNNTANQLYARYRPFWMAFQRSERLNDDRIVDVKGATVAVIGMGRIGTGSFDNMRERYGDMVLGIDVDPQTIEKHHIQGRRSIVGDPSDADFWERIDRDHSLNLVLLALPQQSANLAIIEQLAQAKFRGTIAAIAKFPDEVEELEAAGANIVFNVYAEAGTGFATHVLGETDDLGENEPQA